jgi:two-component system, OmpR family, copper resistance phosphate regulon response regulator CusR
MQPEVLKLGSLVINTKSKEVSKNGQRVRLRKKEYDLLEFMAIHKDRVLNRITILEYVWNYNACIETNTLEVHMAALRRKLKAKFMPKIKTIHGLGYKLCDSFGKPADNIGPY